MLPQSTCQRLAPCEPASAGTRCLLSLAWCQSLAGRLRQHAEISAPLPPDHVAVQCTYFEKSIERNWLVPVHQDLSIPVAHRVPKAGLNGWSEKEGMLFVQPPIEVLESLVAVRLHLDACTEADGPLVVIPGTHKLGLIDDEAAVQARRGGPVVTCAVQRGDALVLRPLLLHASSKASGISMRRVLHFLFGPRELPLGLQWRLAV